MSVKKSTETTPIAPITPEFIEQRICLVRGKKVMLDSDLSELYGVRTMRLNEQVKRNIDRFPPDFMFRLSIEETKKLNLSQIAIGPQKHRDPRLAPYVFTELGVAMLSSILRSDQAVKMNIFIMRAFVKLREMLSTHKDLAQKVEELQKAQGEDHDDLVDIAEAVDRLTDANTPKYDAIGFQID
jgi:hypothetical protein